jgi:flagellar FliJ protein
MAKFEFKLEALLEHRLQVEKEKQRRVAVIQQEIQALQRQIQDAQMRIALENRTLGARELAGRLDMAYISSEKRYVGNLHLKIVYALQKITGIEQTLAAARAELLEAAKSRKVIEKLKEKQFARWRAELERKESAQMDEIGTQLAIRTNALAETAA